MSVRRIGLEEMHNIAGKNEMVYDVPSEGIAFIADIDGHTTHVYKRTELGDYEEIELNLREMVLKICEGFDKEAFIDDILKTMEVETLLKVKKRLGQRNARVRSGPGCFDLFVSGGRGKATRIILKE